MAIGLQCIGLHGRRLWIISLLVALVPAAIVLLASYTAGGPSGVMWIVLASLALLAVFAAATLVVLVIADVINGSSMVRYFWNNDAYTPNVIQSAAICALLFGLLGRVMLIRHSALIAASIAAVTHTLLFVGASMLVESNAIEKVGSVTTWPLVLGLVLISGILAFIAALLTLPLVRLALHLIPRDLRQPLYSWLTARQSLDQSAAQLP